MNNEGVESREDVLARLMARYDEALAGDTPSVDVDDSAVELDPRLAAEWQEAKHCLELLDRARRGGVRLEKGGATSPAHPRALGRFVVERELGRGGLGIVYLAHDPRLGRKVALKIPRVDVLAGSDARQRFLREAEAAARLNHPCLVALYEVGEDGSTCYLASEYCAGPTLAEWLRERATPAPIRQAAAIVLQLTEAVEHAHSRGVLHRDIKPGNVLLTRLEAGGGRPEEEKADSAHRVDSFDAEGLSPKLTDFGMAKLLEQDSGHTRTGAIIGTLAYMSPEQAEGRVDEIDARTDIYALGTVLYELLTGTPPHVGKTDADTLRRLITSEPPNPRRVRRDLPRDLEAITLRCLASRPGDRFATAHELADDLRRFLSGEPTFARPLGALEQSWKWARRRPALAALVGVVFAAAIGLVAMTTVYNSRLGAALDDARRLLYAADMKLAFDAWRGDNASAIGQRIDRYQVASGQADLRTFPWHFLSRQRNGDQANIYSHADTVFAVAWSPDGKLIATGSADSDIRLWDVASGRMRKAIRGHHTDVNDLAFSPDSRLLASCGDDLTLRVWEVDSDDPPRVLKLVTFRDLNSIAFSPDGKWLAAGGEDEKTRIWDTSNWKLARVVSTIDAAVNRIAFSPDSRRLVTTHSSGSAAIVDVASGQVVTTLIPKGDVALGMGAVAFSYDGRLVATASFKRQQVDFWDAESGTHLRTLTSDGNWLHAIAFSPDDRRLFTGHQDGAVRVWDVNTLEELHVLLGHTGVVRDLAVSPNGKSLVSVGVDRTVKLWDLPAIDHRQTQWKFPKAVKTVAFSPTGNMFAFEEWFGPVRLVDAGTQTVQFESDVPRVDADSLLAFSPDGKYLAYAIGDGRSIELLDVASRKSIAHLVATKGQVRSTAFSRSGDVLASGDDQSRLTLWDVRSGKKLHARDTGQGTIHALAFISGGNRIVVAGANDTRVWDARSLETGTLLSAASKKLIEMAVSPDESMLAGASSGGELFVWVLPDLQLKTLLVGHRGFANSVAFSGDGKTLASAGNDGTVRLWDMRTLQEIGAMIKADDTASACETVAFAPDGQTLVAGGARPTGQGVLHIWSLARHGQMGPARAAPRD